MRATFVGWVMVGVVASASGQDFNVDVGPVGSQPPSSSYAAAGQAGVWNSVTAEHTPPFTPGPTPQDVLLVDIDGNQTSVGFHQFGGMNNYLEPDPALAGEDATLLNDYLATHSTSLATCPYLNGLANGTYEVITYAWMPKSPTTQQRVNFDFHPGQTLVGGSWTGTHAEGVTYSRDIIEVTTGAIGWHIAIPPGQPTQPGAAFNGFQVRRLTWDELGGGTPGAAGTPTFVASGSLVPASTMTLELTQTPHNAPLLLWLSFSSTPQAVFGGTLHAVPMANQFLRFSDGAGAYSVSAPWPPGVPVGTKLWLQWLAGDASVASGITLSNAVRATTP